MRGPGVFPSSGLLQPGTRLARHYVIGERIGDGGMAQVYRGEHATIGRPVAIKVLSQSLASEACVAERFLREARASSKVRHENVVEVTDFGELPDGRPFIVMEFLEGENLERTLRREGRLPWERVRPMLLQVLAALQAAHAEGVIHRDIKPGNMFRISRTGSDDFIKVFDFGIAKVLLEDALMAKPLTLEGQMMGTPVYMSPEQCVGDPVDARTDLYATGIITYEMLTGRPPFADCNELSILVFNHINTRVPKINSVAPDLQLPKGVEALVQRALQKKPSKRFASAQEFAEAVLAIGDDSSSSLLPALRDLFRRRR